MVCTGGGSAPSRLWPRLEQPGQVRRLGVGWGGRLKRPAPLPEYGLRSACSAPAQLLTHWAFLSSPRGLCIGLVPPPGSPHLSPWLFIAPAHCTQAASRVPFASPAPHPGAAPAPGSPSIVTLYQPCSLPSWDHRKAAFLRA